MNIFKHVFAMSLAIAALNGTLLATDLPRTADQRGQNNFLGGSRSLACVLNQLRAFRPANPVRHFHFLKMNVQPQLSQLRRNIFHRSLSLGRAAGARSDVLGQMGKLPVRIIIRQGGGLDRRYFFQQLRGKVVLLCRRRLRRRRPRGRLGLLLVLGGTGRKDNVQESGNENEAG